MSTGDAEHDIAIIGLGFAGLATLAHLSRTATALRIAVVADDVSGHGLAYRTRDPSHRLNVVAGQMGAWASDPGHFAGWLGADDARRACDELGIGVPGPDDFAPRALYARYLDGVRAHAVDTLEGRGSRVTWLRARATSLSRAPNGWAVATDAAGELRAGACVLACGNDPRHVFGDLRHPDLHAGPCDVSGDDLPGDLPGGLPGGLPGDRPGDRPGGEAPVVLIGSGLTAVDALLTVRRHSGAPVVALSRHGRLPCAHDVQLAPVTLTASAVARVHTLADAERVARAEHAAGGDWRAIVDAMRPFTVDRWQHLAPGDQRDAIDRFGAAWSVHRHRMAPEVAARVADERASGGLCVRAVSGVRAVIDVGDRLRLEVTRPDGTAETLTPAAVIDCTGPQLDPGRSEQPLLRGLVSDRVCRTHHTGLGFAVRNGQRVADDLYVIGSLLTGQLWESVAVPELRVQAAVIAAAITSALTREPAAS